MKFKPIFFLSFFLLFPQGFLGACGPFLFTNHETDPLSFLDPKLAEDPQWAPFLLYASGPIGLGYKTSQDWPLTPIITVSRNDMTVSHLDNLVYDGGGEALVTQANLAEWAAFLQTQGQKFTLAQVEDFLDGKNLPPTLSPAVKAYLQYLQNPTLTLDALMSRAQDKTIPRFLTTRWAFQAVKLAATGPQASRAPALFAQLKNVMEPGALSTQRAFAYQAGTKKPLEAIKDFLQVFDQTPVLRPAVLTSLMNAYGIDYFDQLVEDAQAPQDLRSSAAFVRFWLMGRDFRSSTLKTLWTLAPQDPRLRSAALAMVQMVEQEGGTNPWLRLLGDPALKDPKGLYKDLIDQFQQIADAPKTPDKGLWYALASYLSLFDGDAPRMTALAQKSKAAPGPSARLKDFHNLLDLFQTLESLKGKPLTPDADNRLLGALTTASQRKDVYENRGLYHSLILLLSQKYFIQGQNDLGALALLQLQDDSWSNPYKLPADDDYWAHAYPSNNSLAYLIDVILTPEDLETWKTRLGNPAASALVKHLLQTNPFQASDLDYLRAIKLLRSGSAAAALPLIQALEKTSFFQGPDRWRSGQSPLPAKKFYLTETFSIWSLAEPETLKEVPLSTLAQRILQADQRRAAGKKASPEALLQDAGLFLGLQISGFPLVFSQTPKIIHFVDNLEYYPYQGVLEDSPAKEFPLLITSKTGPWLDREKAFHTGPQNLLTRAKTALETIVSIGGNPDREILALGTLAALDPAQSSHWKSLAAGSRYENTHLLEQLRSTCEGY